VPAGLLLLAARASSPEEAANLIAAALGTSALTLGGVRSAFPPKARPFYAHKSAPKRVLDLPALTAGWLGAWDQRSTPRRRT
jgi:hypothetical protein